MNEIAQQKKMRISHANFRIGLCDYHDGANVTHYLGDDEYESGTNEPDVEVIVFDGKTAHGNELIEDEYDED